MVQKSTFSIEELKVLNVEGKTITLKRGILLMIPQFYE